MCTCFFYSYYHKEQTISGFPYEWAVDIGDLEEANFPIHLNNKFWQRSFKSALQLPSNLQNQRERSMYTPAYQKVRELIILKKWITKAKVCPDIATLLLKWLDHAPITHIKTTDFIRNDTNSITMRQMMNTDLLFKALNELVGAFQDTDNRSKVFLEGEMWEIVHPDKAAPILPMIIAEYYNKWETVLPFITIGKRLHNRNDDVTTTTNSELRGRAFYVMAGLSVNLKLSSSQRWKTRGIIHVFINEHVATFKPTQPRDSWPGLTTMLSSPNDIPITEQEPNKAHYHLAALRHINEGDPLRLDQWAISMPEVSGIEMQVYPNDAEYPMSSSAFPLKSDWIENGYFTTAQDPWDTVAMCSEKYCDAVHLSGPKGCCLTNQIPRKQAEMTWNMRFKSDYLKIDKKVGLHIAGLAHALSQRDVVSQIHWIQAASDYFGKGALIKKAFRLFNKFEAVNLFVRLTDEYTTIDTLKFALLSAKRAMGRRAGFYTMTTIKNNNSASQSTTNTITFGGVSVPHRYESTPEEQRQFMPLTASPDPSVQTVYDNTPNSSPSPSSSNKSSSSSEDEYLFPHLRNNTKTGVVTKTDQQQIKNEETINGDDMKTTPPKTLQNLTDQTKSDYEDNETTNDLNTTFDPKQQVRFFQIRPCTSNQTNHNKMTNNDHNTTTSTMVPNETNHNILPQEVNNPLTWNLTHDDLQQVQEERIKQRQASKAIYVRLQKEGDIPATLPSTKPNSHHPEFPITPSISKTSIKSKRTREDAYQSTKRSKRQRIYSPKKTKK